MSLVEQQFNATVQGLYKTVNGMPEPYFDKFVPLNMSAVRPQHARVLKAPVLIICIRQSQLGEQGSPAHVLYHTLSSYFTGPTAGALQYIDAPFDIKDLEDADRYHQTVDGILSATLPK